LPLLLLLLLLLLGTALGSRASRRTCLLLCLLRKQRLQGHSGDLHCFWGQLLATGSSSSADECSERLWGNSSRLHA
jgi:hypothetical protein